MSHILKFALWLLYLSSSTNGANFLVYIGMGSYSHRIPLDPYVDALVERGHKVTFLSGFVAKKPNPKVTEFNPPKLLKWTEHLIEGGELDVYQIRENNQCVQLWFMLPHLGLQACEQLYSDPVFLQWLRDPKTNFDVVVMDSLANECAYGFAHYFKSKVIAFNTGQMYSWNPESNYGIPDESSSIPDGIMHNHPKMGFYDRLITAVIPLVWKAYRELFHFPKLEEVTKQGLNLGEIPSFSEFERNTSLFLVNNHWALDYPRSLPPNVIPVGGLTYREETKGRKPLPKNIDDFVNKGKGGFIYISFGTVAEFTRVKPSVRQAFINTFKKFPHIQFILKSSQKVEETMPPNVLVDSWLPQADILNHPKILLYMTHGGLGGVYEAIFSKVPMICFPVFAEQEFNADIMVHKGFGVKVELTTATEQQISDAINEIVNNHARYKKGVERVNHMLKERPIHPLNLAVWWTEFVLRNDDSHDFIRPLSVQKSWWARRQLDVWIFLLLVMLSAVTLTMSVAYCILKCTFRRICRGGSSSSKIKIKIKEKRN